METLLTYVRSIFPSSDVGVPTQMNETSVDLSWTKGNGNNVIVLAHEGSAVDANPVSGTTYTDNTVFGSGTEIGIGNFVVYDANTNSPSVTVTGLTANTTYYFAVYESARIHCMRGCVYETQYNVPRGEWPNHQITS